MLSVRSESPVPDAAIARVGTAIDIPRNGTIYRQTDPADSVYYVERGLVRLGIASSDGRHAVVALLGAGSFLGECCLDGRPLRKNEASALLDTRVVCIPRENVLRLLHNDPPFAEQFALDLVRRIARAEEDIADLHLHSIEKRLARALLLVAGITDENGEQTALAAINHQTLAEIVGTTRPRVSHFLGKFRREGYVTGRVQLRVNSKLARVLLNG